MFDIVVFAAVDGMHIDGNIAACAALRLGMPSFNTVEVATINHCMLMAWRWACMSL